MGQYKDYIKLRLESLDDTVDTDDSIFVDVDFVGC